MGDDFLRAGHGSRAQLDRCFDPLAPVIIIRAKDDAFVDIGMPDQRPFNVTGIDIEAAGNDHIAQPVFQEQIAPFVDHAPIAGVQPALL